MYLVNGTTLILKVLLKDPGASRGCLLRQHQEDLQYCRLLVHVNLQLYR